jgi:hypothetical protein
MMPSRLLAAFRYASLMQPIPSMGLVLHSARGPAAERSKFDGPHFGYDGSIFDVRIFGSG